MPVYLVPPLKRVDLETPVWTEWRWTIPSKVCIGLILLCLDTTMRGPAFVVLAACLFTLEVLASPSRQQPHVARETMPEAAVVAKHLVHTSVTGVLGSTYPSDHPHTPDYPYAILEYHAPCFPSPDLTFLLFPESISTQNILASGKNGDRKAGYTVSMPIDGVRSPISRARVAFTGNMTILRAEDMSDKDRTALEDCYRRYHPDVFWFPGTGEHPWDAMWARFSPRDVYYVGGFGDTHYIGHIPVDVYERAGEKDA